ncbi:exodeoxyribonuclease V subunit gamma [Pararobbsia silviterrae]|uniref:RecBCD enzyme subunit RecC n=2 Tax=Pararobbsia silviterrae TaxID=1792498 RepID=A0A494XV73_9BURK|nr:exodeoxyribonuclease V subunit gamma [Pararobbsia silviterrae]
MLVHGNRSEHLRDLLVQWIKRYPLAPLETEIVLVQSNGIAQWLKLALAEDVADDGAGGCGIAAALDVSLPSRFIWQVYRTVLGRDAVAEVSPFDRSRLVWRLMRVLPALAQDATFAPLQRFLHADDDRRKRFQLADRLADLFDQYQMYRADWLDAWARHDDVLIDARGYRAALPVEQAWQPALWRALLADVEATAYAQSRGASQSNGGRAAVHAAFLAHVGRQAARPKGLPRRVIVFGISSMPQQSLEVLAAIAQWTQVLMCVPNPCAHYWADIVADNDWLHSARARQQRRAGMPDDLDENALHLYAQPLLAAWGKQGRDFIGLLDEYDSADSRERYRPTFAGIGKRIDLFEPEDASTLLEQLQDDIRDLRPLRETRETWPEVDPEFDTSIRFHIAHSALREVEILHDQLLAAFNADPTLKPRDVIVMVPDIDAYAPHIQAVFGLLDRDDPRHIPFSLADRGQRHADPLIGALDTLLGLPRSRLAVSDLLDLLEVPALRKRFAIDEADVPKLRAWIHGANIRWGLDAEQRASLDLPREAHDAAPHTWAFGLRRMLLGYAVGDDVGPWREIEPYGEIGGLDAVLIGPLVELIDALETTWRVLREPATVPQWCERLRALRNRFFSASGNDDALTLARLDAALESWFDICDEAALDDALPLSVVGEYWLAQLDDTGLSQRFFAGAVTFATLMPMRAIPFRRVCLLGMNDGDFPRMRVPTDFDLMAKQYRPGDRSRREDDRYLLLEALLSAREHLHVSWIGRSINDNSERPPSVLVSQLRDHLAAGWRLEGADDDPRALLDALTVEHRLQPFSAGYFPDDPQLSRLFTYAREWRMGSVSDEVADDGLHDAADDISGHGDRLAPLDRDEPLSLRELADFLKHPVRAFLSQRLRVALDVEVGGRDDHEPFDLDGLKRWSLQNELIRTQTAALRDGEDVSQARRARLDRIRRRGDLAAGGFGDMMADALDEPMDALFATYREALERWPHTVDEEREVRYAEADAARRPGVADWLGAFRYDDARNEARVLIETSDLVKDGRFRGDRLVGYWIEHLAANLDGRAVTTVVVSKKGVAEFAPLARGDAEAQIGTLLDAWREGMCRPLPLAVRTAFDWLRAMGADGGGKRGARAQAEPPDADALAAKARAVARVAYEGAVRAPGEVETSASLQRVYPDFASLTSSGEFMRLAQTLLSPVLTSVVRAKDREAGASSPSTETAEGEA